MKIFVSWIYNLSAIQNVIHSKNSFKMVFADYQGRKTTMSHYHHLGTTERKMTLRMHVEGKNVWAKNHVLERTASIINCELRWNGGKKRSYFPSETERRNGRCRKYCHKKTVFCSLAAKALVQYLFWMNNGRRNKSKIVWIKKTILPKRGSQQYIVEFTLGFLSQQSFPKDSAVWPESRVSTEKRGTKMEPRKRG